MNIIFYRYNSILETDIINTFRSFGINVIEEKTEMTVNEEDHLRICVDSVHQLITQHSPLFVFSINFFPVVAEVCHIHNVLYLSWSVDCPVMEYFTTAMKYPTNRIFLFDKAQYNLFHPYNPDCIFHLPLAANVSRFDSVIQSITDTERKNFSSDISFVGSLYSEKNPLTNLANLSAYAQGCIDGIIESSLQIYGYNFMEATITDKLIEEFEKAIPNFYNYNNLIQPIQRYVIAHHYLGMAAAETERIRTLNALAEHFNIDLYTNSDVTPLHSVTTHGPVESLYVMPKVFHQSKINLNMTMKAIQTGLPLRIFDIMGCGGFLMTNYQAELDDYFEIGKDLEAYSSLDELLDKCAYYLTHEDIRKRIAIQGYESIKQFHTYPNRIAEMIRIISSGF